MLKYLNFKIFLIELEYKLKYRQQLNKFSLAMMTYIQIYKHWWSIFNPFVFFSFEVEKDKMK